MSTATIIWTVWDNLGDRPVTAAGGTDWQDRLKFFSEEAASDHRKNLTSLLPPAKQNLERPLYEVRKHTDAIRRANRRHG